MIFALGAITGIIMSFCFGFYRYLQKGYIQRRAGHQYVVDILSTNEGIDYARKFLYVCPTPEWDMYKKAPNEKNQKFSLYEPLRCWYENC